MILTDDNFATIVAAVEGGRGIYDNLMKYVRVQLVMLGGFILTFVGAGIFDVAGGAPLTPLQILWINFAVDVLLAIGLGFDAPVPGLMRRGRGRERADRRPGARHPARRSQRRHGRLWHRSRRLGRGPLRPGRRHHDGPDDPLADAHRRLTRGTRADRDDLHALYVANRRFVQLIGATVLTFLVTEPRRSSGSSKPCR